MQTELLNADLIASWRSGRSDSINRFQLVEWLTGTMQRYLQGLIGNAAVGEGGGLEYQLASASVDFLREPEQGIPLCCELSVSAVREQGFAVGWRLCQSLHVAAIGQMELEFSHPSGERFATMGPFIRKRLQREMLEFQRRHSSG